MANTTVSVGVRIITVVSLLVASCVCGVCMYLGRAKAQEKANSAAVDAPSRLTQKTKQVDLGGGVTFIEVTGESEDGKVRLRLSMIRRDGKFLMMRIWSNIPSVIAGKGYSETLTQSFYRDGQEFAAEIDKRGDGAYHLLALLDKEELPSQVFDVKKNGELVPVRGDRFRKMREGAKLTVDVMKPIVEGAKKGASEPEMQRRIEGAIKKASDGRQGSE